MNFHIGIQILVLIAAALLSVFSGNMVGAQIYSAAVVLGLIVSMKE